MTEQHSSPDYSDVALVYPRFRYPSGDLPLGLAGIATSLRLAANGRGPAVFDATVAAAEALKPPLNQRGKSALNRAKQGFIAALTSRPYRLIGFSVMTTMQNDALEIAAAVKDRYPGTLIVFGGPHPTMMPAATLANRWVDGVLTGEGEVPFRQLATTLDLSRIWHKTADGRIASPIEPPANDFCLIDQLSTPLDFSGFDLDWYLDAWTQLDAVNPKLKGLNIISSRGCPYRCSFCQPTLEQLFGVSPRIRFRSADNLIAELTEYRRRYQIEAFFFQDDTFAVNPGRVEQFCRALIKSKLGLVWGCNLRADLTLRYPRLLKLMVEAGLRKVNLGIESGSNRVLAEIYQKDITVEQVLQAVKLLNNPKYNLKLLGFFMLGAPGETVEEIKSTIKLACRLPLDEASFSITTPLPGTYLYQRTFRELASKVSNDFSRFDYYTSYVYRSGTGCSEYIDQKSLDRWRRLAYLAFYLSPRRWSYTARSFVQPAALAKTWRKLQRF